ncbi:alpha/beta hydrolase family esterase [Luteipulveratus flavus]|uniref:PHB depolymerase family esterase n=1 Tax=Luteipulveratus flavus TaxID=3031728 RepID=A0ABT6C2E7_9MICO|nr:alpha/beta fold hydrolase [Luteipulveratus sp. YIM 133296]MDF8262806.1 PHB depolymerase family esterase [Luteipulveratus sp. YIM 133296]
MGVRALTVGGTAAVAAVGGAVYWLLGESAPPEPTLPGRLERHRTVLDGRERTWTTYVPDGLRGPAPLLLVLHGSGDDGAAVRRQTGYAFDRLADRHGFVVAYPDGYRGNWNEPRIGGRFAAKELGLSDVDLLRDVATSSDEVDPRRVYATGFSSGGQMALRLALEAPDLVAAIAPVAANVPTTANLAATDLGMPVPALFVTGTADPMNPYGGGEVRLYGTRRRGRVRPALEGARWFAERNGITGDAAVERISDRGSDGAWVESHHWAGSEPVRLLSVHGGGHHYPAVGVRGRRLLGPSPQLLDTPARVWEFVSAHRRPE